MAVVFTWVFNNTKGSVLLAILAHGSFSMGTFAAYDLFPVPAVTEGFANFVVGIALLALVIVVFTRGRLGYGTARKAQRQAEAIGVADRPRIG